MRRRNSGRRWTIWIVLLLVSAGVAAYLLRRPVPHPPETTSTVREEAPPPAPEETAPLSSTTPPPAETALAPLAESDAFAREVAGTLTHHPALAGWLANDALIRRFVAVVDNVADGVSPRPHLGFLAPAERFQVIRRGKRVFVDPRSYVRYHQVADVFASLDPRGCADITRRLQPLLEEAYRELGRTDRNFDGALRAAIARLLATPVVEGEVELQPGVTSYYFDDPALEARSAVEKHLLRMGPRNVSRIQEQVRLIASELQMPELGAQPPPEGPRR